MFTGRGPEDMDVGTEGDIYLDGADTLYGKTASGRKHWSDTGETLPGTRWPDRPWIVKLPHLEKYALWVMVTTAVTGKISWYCGTSSALRFSHD